MPTAFEYSLCFALNLSYSSGDIFVSSFKITSNAVIGIISCLANERGVPGVFASSMVICEMARKASKSCFISNSVKRTSNYLICGPASLSSWLTESLSYSDFLDSQMALCFGVRLSSSRCSLLFCGGLSIIKNIICYLTCGGRQKMFSRNP